MLTKAISTLARSCQSARACFHLTPVLAPEFYPLPSRRRLESPPRPLASPCPLAPRYGAPLRVAGHRLTGQLEPPPPRASPLLPSLRSPGTAPVYGDLRDLGGRQPWNTSQTFCVVPKVGGKTQVPGIPEIQCFDMHACLR